MHARFLSVLHETAAIQIFISRSGYAMKDTNTTMAVPGMPNADFCDEVAALPGGQNIRRCFACGTCSAGCPVTAVEEAYSARRIIRQILLGMREEVLRAPEIWYCQMCYRCSSRCPQEVNFTDIMRALRYLALKAGYAPAGIIKESAEADTLSQTTRRDMLANAVKWKKRAPVKTKKA
jgi:heterodisulfide reductase subunit C